jgi:hypothetical protein
MNKGSERDEARTGKHVTGAVGTRVDARSIDGEDTLWNQMRGRRLRANLDVVLKVDSSAPRESHNMA